MIHFLLYLAFFWYHHPIFAAILAFFAYHFYERYQSSQIDRVGQPAFPRRKTGETPKPEAPEAIIIGAGQAGLAAASSLKAKGIESIIFEKTDQIAPAWRKRYDRLHLHTSTFGSSLPYWPYPSNFPQFPSRDQVVAYYESYARIFDLKIKFNHTVKSVLKEDDLWTVKVENDIGEEVHKAKYVVIATGETTGPNRPTFEGENDFTGSITHASEYSNGKKFAGKKVLVVGFGNTGGEIALDLWEYGAKPSILIRSPVNIIPRWFLLFFEFADHYLGARLLPPPTNDHLLAFLNKQVYGDLGKYGIITPNPKSLIGTAIYENHTSPLIDIGFIDIIRKGELAVFTKDIKRFTKTGVVFADGREEVFDDVILATGYHFTDFTAILNDETKRKVVTDKGVALYNFFVPGVDGLFLIGFRDAAGKVRQTTVDSLAMAEMITKTRK